MSINQISNANTFGQLITAVSAMIAVANNLTDGPQVVTNAAWTFSNPGVGINVGNTAIITTANVGLLNTSQANVTNETVGRSNISTANVTVANIVGATVTNLTTTDHLTANANVTGLLQVSDRANVFSANIQTLNVTTLAVSSLTATGLTLATLNTSFANVTDISITNTLQTNTIIAVLTTIANANVSILNASVANLTGATMGTMNASVGNVTTLTVTGLTVGTVNISSANITTIPTINSSLANLTTANVGVLNASTANLTSIIGTTLAVTTGNIVSLNAASANIVRLNVAANPTVNLEVATKNYADTGAGGNLVNKLSFNAKGDIIVGSGANTYATQNVGTNGQILIVDTNMTTGVRYTQRPTGVFRGLVMGTSLDNKSANGTQLVIYNLDEAQMDDGEVVSGWTPLSVIDISSNGAVGFLDTGVAVANTWYEAYAIRNRTTGAKNFLLHRAKDRIPDQNTSNAILWPTGSPTIQSVGANNTTSSNVRLAQSFTPNTSGRLTSIEIRSFKTGATANGNIWLTLEGNTAASPNGTTLATSRKMDIIRLQVTSQQNLRFVFDNTAVVNVGTSYFWVFNTDTQQQPAAAFLGPNVVYSLANTAFNANGVNEGVPKGYNGASWVDLRPGVGTFIYKTYVEANDAAITMPTGYDQQCLIGYTCTNANTRLKEFVQKDRTVTTYFSAEWASPPQFQTTTSEVLDLSTVVPPVPVLVGFSCGFAGGSPLIYSLGRFHALNLPTTHVEGPYGGGYAIGQANGGTSAMILPFFIEHQAVLIKSQTAGNKLYPVTWTF